MGLWYTKDSGFELTGFSDADYAGCKDTFKSTSGGAQFLGEKLLTDYGFHFNKIPIYCDSKSAIAISYNPIQHSRTKHIVVRYHFIKEHVEKELGRLVGKLASASVFYGRCDAFEEVAKMKDPFDLSKVKGYRSSYKKEHTKAENDLATDTFPFLSEFIVDPFAPIEVLPSKKP
ncbi:hypothetical protein Tco_0973562 [Tanacetum coccineum]